MGAVCVLEQDIKHQQWTAGNEMVRSRETGGREMGREKHSTCSNMDMRWGVPE